MSIRHGTSALLGVAAAAVLLGGCTRLQGHQGYILDETLISAIQPGVDNKESVIGTIGRPSFVGQFDPQQRDWYYFSRQTRQLAFRMPQPHSQTVVHVRFDANGNVERVERTGLDLVANIRPTNDETPTLGRNRGLLEELFGNIGAVGQQGVRGQTADNPQ